MVWLCYDHATCVFLIVDGHNYFQSKQKPTALSVPWWKSYFAQQQRNNKPRLKSDNAENQEKTSKPSKTTKPEKNAVEEKTASSSKERPPQGDDPRVVPTTHKSIPTESEKVDKYKDSASQKLGENKLTNGPHAHEAGRSSTVITSSTVTTTITTITTTTTPTTTVPPTGKNCQ